MVHPEIPPESSQQQDPAHPFSLVLRGTEWGAVTALGGGGLLCLVEGRERGVINQGEDREEWEHTLA